MTVAIVSERDFQGAVVEYARLTGWLCAHFRPAATGRGWRTPVAADGAGFPDLTLVRGDRIVFCELKTERGTVRAEQRRWLEALEGCGAVESYLWRPADWPAIEQVLR